MTVPVVFQIGADGDLVMWCHSCAYVEAEKLEITLMSCRGEAASGNALGLLLTSHASPAEMRCSGRIELGESERHIHIWQAPVITGGKERVLVYMGPSPHHSVHAVSLPYGIS